MPCIRDDNDENFTPTISDDQSIVSTIADTIADKSDESFDSLLHAATEDRLAATEDDEYGPIESYWFERVAADEDTKIARSTIADDSCDERPRSRSPSGHIDRLFSAEVKYRLCHYDHGQYPWLRTHHVTVQGQRNFEDIVQEKKQLILDIAADDYDFKIGITYDPIHRWSLPKGPYCYDWEFMLLLYAATASEKEAQESSGRLEKNLIDTMCTLTQCKNKANTGGLSPTPGRPHWCYCVFKQTQREFGNYVSVAEILRGDKVFWKDGLLRGCPKFPERVEL